MTARSHYDWHLVGHGSDPVPVDRWDIDRIADDMRERATTASSIRSTLSRLSQLDGWAGEAAEEFGEKSGKVLEDLGKVVDRYEDVASALDWWAHEVDTARSSTARAVLDAEDAQRRIESNDVDVASGPDPSQALLDQQSQADTRKAQAVDDLADAQQAMRAAMSDLDSAAETAKGKIDDAADHWDDGAWGDVKGFLRKGADFVEILCTALEVIGAILGAVILVLALTIGAPFALLVAALVIAVAVLAGHLFLMMLDEGDISKEDIFLDLAGVALSVTGLKSLTSVINGLRGAVPAIAARVGSTSRMAALTRLTNGNVRLYDNALRFANPTGGLARWAQGIRSQADIAEITARVRVLSVLDQQPGRLAVLLHQDREIAQLHHLVRNLRTLDLDLLQAGQVSWAQFRMGVALGSTTGQNLIAAYQSSELPDKATDVYDYVTDLPVFSSRPVP